MRIFSKVNLWRDELSRSPAGQMAMDEAILRNEAPKSEESAILRVYRLPEEAVTLGFFMPISEVDDSRYRKKGATPRPRSIVRRLTGGGIVHHGSDITFSLVVGRQHRLSAEPTADRYRIIHEALRDSLAESEIYPNAQMVAISASDSKHEELACFAKPVGWDVLDEREGHKIAGGAQRRSGGAWLHQGTVQIPGERSIFSEWITRFAAKLGPVHDWAGNPSTEAEALDLEKTRYSTAEWNERI